MNSEAEAAVALGLQSRASWSCSFCSSYLMVLCPGDATPHPPPGPAQINLWVGVGKPWPCREQCGLPSCCSEVVLTCQTGSPNRHGMNSGDIFEGLGKIRVA